jgi:hypothetical protein
MKRVPTLFFLTLLLIGIVSETRADMGKPSATPARAKVQYSEITVETDSKAYDARLQISEATLKQLSAMLA